MPLVRNFANCIHQRLIPPLRSRLPLLVGLGILVTLAMNCGGSSGPAELGVGTPQQIVLGPEPAAFDFTPDGRLFFTLRQAGEIRWVDLATVEDPSAAAGDGELFAQLDTFLGLECGLLGIAVDPEFSTNHYIYVYLTQPVPVETESGKPRIIRFTDVDGKGSDPTVIVDDLPLTNPLTCAHVGGNVQFGPDGYLYLSLGNMERADLQKDLANPLGKILRMDKSDGSGAPDNPFVDDPNADGRIFAYGLRNPWDFAFHPETGKLYAQDNGDGSCDELNIIEAGLDYGAPESALSGDVTSCLGLGGVDPIYLFARPGKKPEQFSSNVAPAGVAFVSGDAYPEVKEGGLLVCEFNTMFLRYLELEGEDNDEVARDVVLADDCRFNVGVDGEGIIYYSTAGGINRLVPD